MTETKPPSPRARQMLIPLDDREALLALKDFDRGVRGEADDQPGRDGQTPARRSAA
jgi:hypothetical protein